MNGRIRQWVVTSWEIPVCGILLCLLLTLNVTSLRHKGLITDEPFHYQDRLSRVVVALPSAQAP